MLQLRFYCYYLCLPRLTQNPKTNNIDELFGIFQKIESDLNILESKLVNYLLTPNQPTNQIIEYNLNLDGALTAVGRSAAQYQNGAFTLSAEL